MTSLRTQLDRYLVVRRHFGYDLSTTERVLKRLVEFADAEQADYITTALFLKWKDGFGSAGNGSWSARLGMVRGFAGWLRGINPRNEVPPIGLIPGRFRRARPFIYAVDQVAQIVGAAAKLPSSDGLRGITSSTLLGLIAVTGLRISEAIGLDDGDVDLDEGVLTVRRGKNGKSRWLPIATSTAERLAEYRRERVRLDPGDEPAFFRLVRGRRLTDCGVRYNFALVCQQIGLRDHQPFHKHGRGPRIHDLRHTFAVRTIIGWYRQGLDPDREMIRLSTYLGHSDPDNTYWYIEAVPELLGLASERAGRSLAGEGATK